MLESIVEFHPKVSAILNITPDHLNRHHTMDNYIAAKERIAENQTKADTCVLNYDDELLRAYGENCPADVLFFSRLHKLCLLYTSTIAAAMVLWSCVTYLQLQAETTSRVKNIAALETELEDLKKENDDNYTRIMTSVDLDYIRDVAINELGMVYANEDQVILYDGGTKDYVRQSQDVPKDSKTSLMDQFLGKNGK